MAYFKAIIETGKKTRYERAVFIQRKDIIDAYDVTKKIRYGKLQLLKPVSRKEYMKGIDKKYDDTTKTKN